jgi:hypothetical protein
MKAISIDAKKSIQSWVKFLKQEGKMHKEQGSEGMAYDYEESAAVIELLLDKVYTEEQRMVHCAEQILSEMDITTEEAIKRIHNHKHQHDLIDNVEGISVWEAVEDRFTCHDFLNEIYFNSSLLK